MSSKPKSPTSEVSSSPNPSEVESFPAAPSQPKQSFLDRLPPWVATNIRSKQSRKMLFRCWLGSWAAFLVILPDRTLKTMGNAAFFGFLTSLLLPPSFPVQFFFFMISTVLVGTLLGWAIGAAGMKAALAARNKVLLQSSLQVAKETASGFANPDQVFRIEIFQGDFLDIRSSVVFGVFLAIGTFVFAIIRAYYKSLIFMSIFGTIAIDIYCAIGPLFPFHQFYLLNNVLIPVSIYTAIALVVTIFVFPQTANHAFLGTVTLLLGQLKVLLDAQEDLLAIAPGSITPEDPKISRLRAIRASMFAIYQGLTFQGKFINAEFSWGRWNGDDARRLEGPLLSVISRTNGLLSFMKYVGRNSTARDSESVETKTSQSLGMTDTFLVQQLYQHNEASERQHSLRLVDLLPQLREATHELRSAASNGLTAVSSTINFVNTTRWSLRSTADDLAEQGRRLDSAAERLRSALADFKASGRLRLLEPFEPHLGTPAPPLRALYMCYVYSASIVVVADAIIAVMETVQETTTKRKKNRLWAPKGLRQLAHAFLFEKSTEGDLRAYGENQEVKEVVPEGDGEGKYRRDPDSREPTNVLQKIMSGLHVVYRWTKTPEALFVFRYVFISIALWVPSVVKSTAHFYYVQKGLWALVMAQTTLTIYAGDQLYNYFIRLTGTFIGLIVGLLIWYVGNANSRGSVYGIAASVAVFLVPLMFCRLFAPQQYLQGTILMASTVVLIVGYSWIDGHLTVISNVGIGWPVAWKRWTLVMIGSAASFIVMLFPAKSARKAVRLGCAMTMTSLSHVYASVMSAWISGNPSSKELKSGKSTLADSLRQSLSAVALQLRDLKDTAGLARWEGSVRGHWPYDDYMRLAGIQEEMVAVFAQLASALSELDDKWRSDFLHHTKVLNPNFISDVLSVFSIVAQSLRTGEPMHTVLPQNLLDRLLYHDAAAYAIAPTLDVNMNHIQELRSLDYLFYATAVIGVLQLIELLDELHNITRNLCGEVPFKDFGQWKDVHQRAHVSTPKP
ncbi:hypothetical protein B0F90DRAFT_1723438 [Multifurca ochricompacta]|uniref:ER transporter 6TM N-terminal domain-containing protein n=1 Tax=Multifurca ochricompacta TaxID=376703 RepID=A0AAD4M3C4_9AGAM|nr:hypothetical protein B0F90DRAFT_1723438 [Multifurca ochricompacta]